MNNNILALPTYSLPNDYWSGVMEHLEDPRQVGALNKGINKVYEDKNLVCLWLIKRLNTKGLRHISQELIKSSDLAKAKDSLITRVITDRPKSTLEYFKNTEKLTIFGFLKMMEEEETINLIHLYDKIPLKKPDLASLTLHSKASTIREFIGNNKPSIELIEKLDLRNLSLTAVPEELAVFTGLKKINLRGNDIDFLPASFGTTWENLEKCDLSHNKKLNTLPVGFGNQWKNIEELWIEHNSLPPERVQEIRDAFPLKKWLVR